MSAHDPTDDEAIRRSWVKQIAIGAVRVTLHAHQEMAEEAISYEDVLHAISSGDILENYPEHRRGACCLVHGTTQQGRPLHVVCTTTQPVLILITVYEPRPPKWITPTQRRTPL